MLHGLKIVKNVMHKMLHEQIVEKLLTKNIFYIVLIYEKKFFLTTY